MASPCHGRETPLGEEPTDESKHSAARPALRCIAWLGLWLRAASQLSGHKHAVRILHVTAERSTALETKLGVEPVGGLEELHRAGFQAQAAIASLPGLR